MKLCLGSLGFLGGGLLGVIVVDAFIFKNHPEMRKITLFDYVWCRVEVMDYYWITFGLGDFSF